jgi:asparagine synthase (glutamine-hydrolysing)
MSKPGSFFRQLKNASGKMGLSKKYIALQIIKALMPRSYASYVRSKYSEKIYGCLDTGFIKENRDEFANPAVRRFSSSNLDTNLKHNITYQGFNQILHYEDHSSMQSSIEMRSPFIDYRLMELAFSVPSEEKIDNGITKKILREAFRDLLPSGITNNYRKIGFVTPFDDWTNDPALSDFISDITHSNEFRDRSIFNHNVLNRMLTNKKGNNFPLWRLLNLELWIRSYGITNL